MSLEVKAMRFQDTLSEIELMRFQELRPSDKTGTMLTGDVTWNNRNLTYPSSEIRTAAVKSLGAKLMEFQKTLTPDELSQLLYELSGEPDRHQSKFGVECRDD